MTGRKRFAILSAGILLLAWASAQAGQGRIFKTVDADGNVVFTDIPPREDQTGQQIVIEDPNSFAPEAAAAPTDQWIVEPEADAEEAPFAYRSLAIASPADDEAVRENAGNVTVVTNVNPNLRTGHVMRLLVDGQAAGEGRQAEFSLENVDRGTHTLTVEIVDDNGDVLIRSPSTTFHMLRASIARQPRSS